MYHTPVSATAKCPCAWFSFLFSFPSSPSHTRFALRPPLHSKTFHFDLVSTSEEQRSAQTATQTTAEVKHLASPAVRGSDRNRCMPMPKKLSLSRRRRGPQRAENREQSGRWNSTFVVSTSCYLFCSCPIFSLCWKHSVSQVKISSSCLLCHEQLIGFISARTSLMLLLLACLHLDNILYFSVLVSPKASLNILSTITPRYFHHQTHYLLRPLRGREYLRKLMRQNKWHMQSHETHRDSNWIAQGWLEGECRYVDLG